MIQNQWYAIMSSKEVKKGALVAVKRLGLELCLFRQEDGQLGCVVDQCVHRGAALSKGLHKGNCVACPFHGLQFDKDGTCKLIPANGRIGHIESRYNVKSYAVREEHDIIYLWYGEKETATGTGAFFSEFIDDSYIYSEMTDLWNAHYSRCIENQLDVVHLPFVHYNTIGRGNKTVVNGPALELIDGTITITANNSVDAGQPPIPASECHINPKMNLRFRFPNIWQNLIAEKIKIVIFFAPVDGEHTILYIRFYTNLFGAKFMNHLMAQVGKVMNKRIERQDKRCVETQRPKPSSLHGNEKLLKGDSPIIMYRTIREELQKQAGSANEKA